MRRASRACAFRTEIEADTAAGESVIMRRELVGLLGADMIASNAVAAIGARRRVGIVTGPAAPATDEHAPEIRHVEMPRIDRAVDGAEDAEQPRVGRTVERPP